MGGAESPSLRSPSRAGVPAWRGVGRPGSPRLPLWFRENLQHSFPILAVGAFCVGIAVWLDLVHLHAFGSRMPLWTLVAAVGVTLVGGGSALTMVEEPPEPAAAIPAGYLLVSQHEWDSLIQAAGTPPVPAAAPPEVWQEAPEIVEEPLAPEAIAPSFAVDPDAVARASADLVGVAPASEPESLVAQPAAAATAQDQEPLAAPPSASPPEPPAPEPPRVEPAVPRVTLPSVERAVPSPTTTEFQNVLNLLERAEVSVRSRITPELGPAQPRDRCTGCGLPVSTYSEQICVMCDRPLCDRCVDRTAEAGHPQMCDACHAKLPP
jgi:hypothetical protein